MKNPFKDNSLASFLMGTIIGVGGCVGYYSITEPEYPTNPQGQIAGIMGTPVADNDNQQQTNLEENTQTQFVSQLFFACSSVVLRFKSEEQPKNKRRTNIEKTAKRRNNVSIKTVELGKQQCFFVVL